MIELRHLRYFIAVAEDLHFTRAATRLNIAQPPLSQQIQQLERIVGTQLLVRSSRSVSLTPAGEVFLSGARRVLADLDRSLQAARRAESGAHATLRVGFTDSAALSVLPDILHEFGRRHPTIHLDLSEDSTHAQVLAVQRELTDVAIVRGPIATPDLSVETVHREGFSVALPADHRYATATSLSLAKLASEPLVMFPRRLAPEFHDLIMSMCLRGGFTPHVVHEVAQYQTMLSLVAGGLGISIVPTSIRNLPRRGVEFRTIRGARETADIQIVWRGDAETDSVGAFVAVARDLCTVTRSQKPGRRREVGRPTSRRRGNARR
jgi:DNA-binding transcriptional LysR family regulator